MKNLFNKLYIILASAVIVLLSGLMFFSPDKDFSDKENRALTARPTLSGESFWSGEYTEKLGVYFADQFPLRNLFVGTKAYFELLQGKGENNGVILADDGVLIPRPDLSELRLKENLNCINTLKNNTGAEITVVALPRTVDVFSELLPKTYPADRDKQVWDEFFSTAQNLNLCSPDVYNPLCESGFYYKTDHHYTVEGAYLTYKELGSTLGFSPKNEGYFKPDTVTEDFCGTAIRTSGLYLAKRDKITLYRYEGDTDYNVLADGKKIGLYDFSALKKTDKYSVFLGGNHARVDITANGEKREKLLIIRDSFADSIVPFLSIHYDLTLIDLRYFSGSVAQIIKNENINMVMIFESISEIATAKNLSYLKMK